MKNTELRIGNIVGDNLGFERIVKRISTDKITIYDKENNELCRVLSKFNRMIAFNSDALHSRNIFKNFGEGNNSRLIQVIFLEKNEY
jgi:hypothetical protein